MTTKLRAALVAALLATLILGVADASAIVGGDIAPPGRWPWMAALVDQPDDAFYGQFCGATVIGTRRLLTAAHCVYGERASQMSVVLGRSRLTDRGGRTVHVTGVSSFPGYAESSYGLDAAVVTVGEDLGVAPVALASTNQFAALAPGAAAWTMGWGQIVPKLPSGARYSADRLRQLSVPVVGDDACERAYGGGYGSLSYRPSWELCAGGSSTGTCYGDSGGPLVVQEPAGWTQVGIVQSSDGCAEPGYPDIFTRVDRVRRFALSVPLTLQPESTSPTRIRGRFAVGHVLTCERGSFSGSPAHYFVYWTWVNDRGEPTHFVAAMRWHHKVTRADTLHRLTCGVSADNAGGSYTEQATPRER